VSCAASAPPPSTSTASTSRRTRRSSAASSPCWWEPTRRGTIAILRGIKEKYEVHHGIKITDDACVAAACSPTATSADRKLPDKAIDLIDEAASRIKMEIESKPGRDRPSSSARSRQLEVELQARSAGETRTSQRSAV
jgi:ATP-dependent Clp protease ATP-binding subunit ClpB